MNKMTMERDGKITEIIYGFSPSKLMDVGCITVTIVNNGYTLEIHEDCEQHLVFNKKRLVEFFKEDQLCFDPKVDQICSIRNTSFEDIEKFAKSMTQMMCDKWDEMQTILKREKAKERAEAIAASSYGDY